MPVDLSRLSLQTGSPRHSASGGVDRKPSEASMLAIAHHPHRISLRGSKLDEHMMRELDGVSALSACQCTSCEYMLHVLCRMAIRIVGLHSNQ